MKRRDIIKALPIAPYALGNVPLNPLASSDVFKENSLSN